MLIALAQFVGLALVVLYAGSRLSIYGDVIAEKSGLGRTWIGVVLMASVTSIPELATGISAIVLVDSPDIAAGDVLGSCMFNLVILALLDVWRRGSPLATRAHSGHIVAAAFGILLLVIAALALLAREAAPSIGWIGLYTPLILAIYLLAMRTIFRQEQQRSSASAADLDPQYGETTLRAAVTRYSMLGGVIIGAAIFLPHVGARIAEQSGLGETVVGNLLIGMSTSLPELVVCFSAIKIGAVDLAYGNLLGSNLFNMGILAIDDIVFAGGPLLQLTSPAHGIAALIAAAMSAVVIIALTVRTQRRIGRVAWDSLVILMLYALSIGLLYRIGVPAS